MKVGEGLLSHLTKDHINLKFLVLPASLKRFHQPLGMRWSSTISTPKSGTHKPAFHEAESCIQEDQFMIRLLSLGLSQDMQAAEFQNAKGLMQRDPGLVPTL